MKSYKFSIQGSQYEVEIISVEDNLANITVNGTSYEIEIQRQVPVTKTPILIRNPVKAPVFPKQSGGGGFLAVRTPLPGNVLSINKNNGDMVKRGDQVLTYEAMKMENKILSEKDGIIRNMKVSAGDIILQDQILFEIE
jgi:biotin carboxyl carrier protein